MLGLKLSLLLFSFDIYIFISSKQPQLSPIADKAGGNKFAKDFEDGSLKLQEFVSFLEKELKTGPPLLEALGNADIFYEMQYKEVKIVANVSGSLVKLRGCCGKIEIN